MTVIAEPAHRYSRGAIVLHWLTAVLMFATIPLGLFVAGEDGRLAAELTNIHKLIGIAILGLTVVRIGWRLTYPPPPLADTTPFGLRVAARTAHLAFYVVLLVLPLSGWWMTSAFPGGHAFGIGTMFEVPFLPVEKSLGAAKVAHAIHETAGKITLALIVVHVAAALKHQFVDRDDILNRMLGRPSR